MARALSYPLSSVRRSRAIGHNFTAARPKNDISANTPGIPIHASLVVPTATVAQSLGRPLPGNASSVTVANIIAPLTVYEDRISQLDLRLTRIFRLGGARRFQANLDVYNALNGSSMLNENTNYEPNWKRPTLILDGRLVKFGGQLSF